MKGRSGSSRPDDVVGSSPVLTVRGRDDLVDQLRRRNQVFRDIDLQVSATALTDGRVVAEWSLSAVHTGRLLLPTGPVPPTSRRVTLDGVAIVRFLGSQIREFRQYWDVLALLQGLGVAAPELTG